MKFLGGPLTPESANRFFDSMVRANVRQPARNVYLAVADSADGEFKGLCSASRIDHRNARAELGLMIAKPARRQRFGREAFSGLITATLQEFSLKELHVHYHVQNAAIKQVLTGAGFSFSRESRERCDETRSSLELAVLTRECWLRG
jgi:RimJ/RimL family protein N-acetyltransferase